MNNKFLDKQIQTLQDDYCQVLKNAMPKFTTDDYPMILDEINIFWYANRDIVLLILRNLTYDGDCFIFTGASFLDINDLEHFPFVTLGKSHIIDDPLYKYASMAGGLSNNDFSSKLNEQMLLTIKDNVKIIENYSDYFCILPVTMLTDINSDLLKKAAEQAFFSMFKDNTINRERYIMEFKTIDDIVNALKDGISSTLIFTENDNINENLSERFKRKELLPFPEECTEPMIFFFLINGFLIQAFSILLKCAEYNMIPYLRYELTFRYTFLLSGNFKENIEVQLILFKAICAHLLYRIFDKRKFADIDFKHYLSTVTQERFSENIFTALKNKGIDYNNLSFKAITDIIQKELDRVIEVCNNSVD